MKTGTTKEIISLAGIAIVTPIFALSILVSAEAAAANESLVSLLAMALCGVVISGLTGFGRRTIKAESRPRHTNTTQRSVSSHS